MRKTLHIFLFVLAVAVSCQGPRVIPRGKMADIYYDMFMADQQIREDQVLRNQADTMLVYEAVFNRYGYDTDDYMLSVRHYLKDPERFSKLMQAVADRLQANADALGQVVGQLDWVQKYMGMKRPSMDSLLTAFGDEGRYRGLAIVQRDSSRYGGWFRLVPVREDTLMVPVDTLSTSADPIVVSPDAPVQKEAVKDTVKPAEHMGKPGRKPLPRKLPVRDVPVDYKAE